jgi:hypothetical protein
VNLRFAREVQDPRSLSASVSLHEEVRRPCLHAAQAAHLITCVAPSRRVWIKQLHSMREPHLISCALWYARRAYRHPFHTRQVRSCIKKTRNRASPTNRAARHPMRALHLITCGCIRWLLGITGKRIPARIAKPSWPNRLGAEYELHLIACVLRNGRQTRRLESRALACGAGS